MSDLTYFVVQTYQSGNKGSLIPDQPRIASSANDARAMGSRMAERCPAVIAFSRSGDPDTGDYGDAVILGTWGTATEDLISFA